MKTFLMVGLAAAGLIGAAGALQNPDVARRIESGSDGDVGLTYSARQGVCGSGFGLLRVGESTFGSGVTYSYSSGLSGECEAGPVRVLIRRMDGRVVSIRVGAGPVTWPEGTTDLGQIRAADAGAYFFALARRSDGRIGRDALVAASVADSTDRAGAQLAIARDGSLSRALRESALSWLGRESAWPASGSRASVATDLAALARDQDAPSSVRARAVTALGRTGPAALDGLLAMAGSDDPALAKAAVAALGDFPDRRAREAIRSAAGDSTRPKAVRLQAITELGGRSGTPADLMALRGMWARFNPELRTAVVRHAGEAGGQANEDWLLSVARSENETAAVRARAVQSAEQAGAGSGELATLYDQAADRRTREAVINALVRIGDRPARTKLLSIAENDTDPRLRRTALNRLARDGDPRVAELLEDLVEKP